MARARTKSHTFSRFPKRRTFFLQFLEDRLPINPLAAIKLVDAHLNFAAYLVELRCPEVVLIIKEAEALPNHFTGGLVTATLDFALNKLLEFWRE